MAAWSEGEEGFRAFVAQVEPRLRRGLMAAYGSDRGREATAEALAVAWERWDQVRQMANPVGYLFRAGQSRTAESEAAQPVRAVRGHRGLGRARTTPSPWSFTSTSASDRVSGSCLRVPGA